MIVPAAPRFLDRTTPPHIVTLILLAGLSALTMNIFLPSLPGMAAWFDAPYALMQLSVALYLGLSALLQIVIGPISDRYGRRPVVLVSMVLFLLATVGTLLAPNATVFLSFRMAQAVIAAGMVLSRAVVRDMVADAQAASMIGYVTMGMSIVPMIGPAIGGVLDQAFGWQASFGLLGVLGLAVLALVWADLGETATIRKVGLSAQLRQYPALLTSRRFWGYALCAAFASGSFFAYLGGAPYVGNVIFGLSSTKIGLLFAITAVGYAAGNFAAGRFSVRVGHEPDGADRGGGDRSWPWAFAGADGRGGAFTLCVFWPDPDDGAWQRHHLAECQCRDAVDQTRACGHCIRPWWRDHDWRRGRACRACGGAAGTGIVGTATDPVDAGLCHRVAAVDSCGNPPRPGFGSAYLT